MDTYQRRKLWAVFPFIYFCTMILSALVCKSINDIWIWAIITASTCFVLGLLAIFRETERIELEDAQNEHTKSQKELIEIQEEHILVQEYYIENLKMNK